MINGFWRCAVGALSISTGALILLVGLQLLHIADRGHWFAYGDSGEEIWLYQRNIYYGLIFKALILAAALGLITAILTFLKNKLNQKKK
jgi:hypothetical protein